jgi:DNA polymerase III subunit beta
MKMTVKTAELKKSLGLVDGVLPGSPAVIITSGVWFSFDEKSLKLVATDLENTLQAKTECAAEGSGEFVLNGKRLVAIISKTGEEEVVFKKKDNEVELSAGKSKYKFLTMSPDEFPRVPVIEKGVELQLEAKAFVEKLKSVSFCVDSDEPRPHFRGVLVDIQAGEIAFVGTDTKQLAANTMEYKSENTIKILLPLKTVFILQKSLETGNTEIHVSGNSINLKQGGFEMTSQLLSGAEDFPDYKKVMPAEKDLALAEIPAAVLKNALGKISTFVTDRYQKILFEFGKDNLKLTHTNPETGEATDEFEIKFAGEPVTVALNPAINAFLGSFSDKSLLLGISGANKPLLLTGEDKNRKYIIMPLKID